MTSAAIAEFVGRALVLWSCVTVALELRYTRPIEDQHGPAPYFEHPIPPARLL